MDVLIIMLGGLFFISSVLLVLFYVKENKRNKELSKENINLMNSIEIIKNDIISTNRKGYYKHIINITDKNDKSKPYEVIIYVKELEQYINNISKIELENIENISGYDTTIYSFVINCAKNTFCTLKDTNSINWLEPKTPLSKQRLDKINKILENISKK